MHSPRSAPRGQSADRRSQRALTVPGTRLYHGHSDNVFAVAWSPDGQYIASGSRDTTVRLWHAATGTCEYVYRGHSYSLLSVAWSPDGRRVASGDTGGTVGVGVALMGEGIVFLLGERRFVRRWAWAPDGGSLFCGGELWDCTVE